MKKILISISLLACFSFGYGFAENPMRKTITFGELEREYLLYLPENTQKFDGLIVRLHGLNCPMDVFLENFDLLRIADSLNYVIIAPQALPEQDPYLIALAEELDNPPLSAIWGCGLHILATIPGLEEPDVELNIELNKEIDDSGFLNALIDSVLLENEINEKNLFMIGISMGGYMTYQYTLLYGERLAGMVSIVGTMGTKIKGLDSSSVRIPVCDFHSLTDEVVPYTGSGTSILYPFSESVTLGKPKNEVIDYWVNRNGAGNDSESVKVEDFPKGNDITVKKFTYPHPEHEVIHYQADGAEHTYVFAKSKGDSMDYMEEILKFFAAHHTSDGSTGIDRLDKQNLHFYPNPAKNTIYFSNETGNFSVYDMTGRLLLSQSFRAGKADVSGLKSGIYIVRISSGEKTLTGKLLKN
jgi:poly(3-hydroxybutyrate) depolymerase